MSNNVSLEQQVRALVLSQLQLTEEQKKEVEELKKSLDMKKEVLKKLQLEISEIEKRLDNLGASEDSIDKKVRRILATLLPSTPLGRKETSGGGGGSVKTLTPHFFVNGEEVELPPEKKTVSYFLQRETRKLNKDGTFMSTEQFWQLAKTAGYKPGDSRAEIEYKGVRLGVEWRE